MNKLQPAIQWELSQEYLLPKALQDFLSGPTAVLAPPQGNGVTFHNYTNYLTIKSISSSEIISVSHLRCNLLPGHSSRQERISRDISQALNPALAFNKSSGQRAFTHTYTNI